MLFGKIDNLQKIKVGVLSSAQVEFDAIRRMGSGRFEATKASLLRSPPRVLFALQSRLSSYRQSRTTGSLPREGLAEVG